MPFDRTLAGRLPWAPLLTLLFLAPFLAECHSDSTPLSQFFHPMTLFLFMTLGYGLPVLVIREWVVRRRMGVGGIFVLGPALGIFNEAFLSKTMISPGTLPIQGYSHYGVFQGINVPWVLVICLYHALSSVLFPIMIVHFLYPDQSETPWLGVKSTTVICAGLMIMGCLSFLGHNLTPGSPIQLIIFLGVMSVCFVLAGRMPGPSPKTTRSFSAAVPILFGLSTLLPILLLASLAEHRLPVVLFFFLFSGVIAFYILFFLRRGWCQRRPLLLFGIGYYLQMICLRVFIQIIRPDAHRLDTFLMAVVITAALLWLAADGRMKLK